MKNKNLQWKRYWVNDVADMKPSKESEPQNNDKKLKHDKRIAIPCAIRDDVPKHDMPARKPYKIYKYNVYNFENYDKYKEYIKKKKSENELIPIISFELAFSSQMIHTHIKKNGKKKKCKCIRAGKTLPEILHKEEREAEVRVLLNNVGIDRAGKFAIQLYTPGKEGKVEGKPKKRKLIYGPKLKNEGNIFIHRWGPNGSEGCATSPNPIYSKKNDNKRGLIKLETFIRTSLNIYDEADTARFVIPGYDVSYPTFTPFEVWEPPEVDIDFIIPLEEELDESPTTF